MPSESGEVVSTSPMRAVVKTIRSEACHSCGAKDMCNSLGGGKVMLVEAENRIGAAPGDRVVIEISDRAFLSGAFFVYFVPVVALVVGAALGNYFAGARGLDPNLSALVAGGAAFAVSMAVSLFLANRMAARSPAFIPRIVSVVRRAGRPPKSDSENDPCPT